MAPKRVDVAPEVVDQLARAAGLPLRPGRATELVPLVVGILADVAKLEDVDVSACEPPVVFRFPRNTESAR